MARKTPLESQKTRDSILDAAERVFADKGVAGTTMAEIADAAGISRGAVYGHYRNTSEVCIAMAERAFTSAPSGSSPCASAPAWRCAASGALVNARSAMAMQTSLVLR